MKYILFFAITILFSFSRLTVFSQDSANVWSGWRGLEKEGVQQETNTPTSWNNNLNILWKTKIPGSGHSSPVVTQNSVIITTAYETPSNNTFRGIVRYLTYGLVLFLILLYLSFLWKYIKSIRENFILKTYYISTFSFIFGFIIYFSLSGLIFTANNSGDHIAQSYRWFYSGMIVALCLIIATFTHTIKKQSKIILITLCISFLFFLLFKRPSPGYYTLTGDGYLVETIQKTEILFICIIIIIILSFFIKQKTALSNHKLWLKSSILIRIIFISIVGGAFLLGFYGIGIYRMLRYPEPSGLFMFPALDIYLRDSNLFKNIVFISITFWSVFYLIKNFHNYIYLSKGFTIGLLCLAALIFVQKNYLTSENEYVRAVICLDRNTGMEKWKTEVFTGYQPNLHPENSPATPTPLVIEDKIFAYFGSPGMVCTDINGNILWENKNLLFEDVHGIGASPIYSDGLIVLLNDMPESPYITALDEKTGNSIWIKQRTPWNGFHGGHRTPLIKEVNGKKLIITWGIPGLIAYELTTGKEVWHYPLVNSTEQLVASIISKNDTLFLPDPATFRALSLSKLNLGIDSAIWITNMKHKGPVCSSPAFYNNLLFTISDNGMASCLNTTNGEVLWREKLNGIYMSSASIIGNNVYFSNTSGQTTVIAAENKFRKVSENNLQEPIYASLAQVKDQLFIRTTSHVWCIKEK